MTATFQPLGETDFEHLARFIGAFSGPDERARLTEQHRLAWGFWLRNLDRYISREIRYLLFGEAVPPIGVGGYAYNDETKPRFRGAIYNGFFGKGASTRATPEKALQDLADAGLMILDCLPYALDYSGRRNTRAYAELVRHGLETHTAAKVHVLRERGFTFAEDLRVACAYAGLLEPLREALAVSGGRIFGRRIEVAQPALNVDLATGKGGRQPLGPTTRAVFELDDHELITSPTGGRAEAECARSVPALTKRTKSD